MSPQLRDGLRATAATAGCSMNAFAVQVLATAVGDPARFRKPEPVEPDLREIERDPTGFPLDRRERAHHAAARREFMDVMSSQLPNEQWVPLVKKYDTEDPAYFVEWARLNAQPQL
jgi:hypothetical protein